MTARQLNKIENHMISKLKEIEDFDEVMLEYILEDIKEDVIKAKPHVIHDGEVKKILIEEGMKESSETLKYSPPGILQLISGYAEDNDVKFTESGRIKILKDVAAKKDKILGLTDKEKNDVIQGNLKGEELFQIIDQVHTKKKETESPMPLSSVSLLPIQETKEKVIVDKAYSESSSTSFSSSSKSASFVESISMKVKGQKRKIDENEDTKDSDHKKLKPAHVEESKTHVDKVNHQRDHNTEIKGKGIDKV
jgi:hypothetical protein